MITGEDVICDFIEDEGGTYMSEPLEISMKTSRGNSTVVLRNWLPIEIINDNYARVNPRNIIAVFDASESVSEYYDETMTKINKAIVASANLKEEGEGMMDAMEALIESQGKVLH
jgi:hypothetical protein